MWSVAAPRSAQPRRDPAPSKWAYRYQRVMLTPALRVALTRVLPVLLLVGGVALWAVQPGPRAAMRDGIARAWASVEARPEFTVSAMVVEGATPALSARVRAAVPVSFPLSQFELDLPQMRDTVAALPAVAQASVHIRSSGILEIRVDERLPVAVWRNGAALHLVDRDGVAVAPLLARAERPDLPLIAGAGAPDHIAEARALIVAAQPIRARLRGLLRRGERRWDVVLDRGQVIMLPETGAVAALERVIALHEAGDLEVLNRDILAVDLRVPHRPTLRLSPAAAQHLRDARLAAHQGH